MDEKMLFSDVPFNTPVMLGSCKQLYCKVGYVKFSTDIHLASFADGSMSAVTTDSPLQAMEVTLKKISRR